MKFYLVIESSYRKNLIKKRIYKNDEYVLCDDIFIIVALLGKKDLMTYANGEGIGHLAHSLRDQGFLGNATVSIDSVSGK